VQETLFLRGLTAPAGHTAWTGLTAGAMWAVAATPTTRKMLTFVGTFIGTVILHTCWDSFQGVIPFIVLALISLGWLSVALRRYRAFDELVGGRQAVPVQGLTGDVSGS
jgi:protease PrsW